MSQNDPLIIYLNDVLNSELSWITLRVSIIWCCVFVNEFMLSMCLNEWPMVGSFCFACWWLVVEFPPLPRSAPPPLPPSRPPVVPPRGASQNVQQQRQSTQSTSSIQSTQSIQSVHVVTTEDWQQSSSYSSSAYGLLIPAYNSTFLLPFCFSSSSS